MTIRPINENLPQLVVGGAGRYADRRVPLEKQDFRHVADTRDVAQAISRLEIVGYVVLNGVCRSAGLL